METVLLTDAELDRLAIQVDDQLKSLYAFPPERGRRAQRGPGGGDLQDAPQQRGLIETVTGETFEDLW